MSALADFASDRFMTGLIRGGSLLAALWVVMSFTYPFGWDQGLFAWVGDAIVRGGLPYRDAWDFKGPLLYYVYALAQWLFGVHLWSIRVVDATFLGVASAAVFRTAAALADKRTALFAAVLYLLWYASHSYWHTSQPDGWAGMLLIVAVGLLLSDFYPTAGRVAGAGFCLGLAALLKPLWLVFILVPGIYIGLSKQMNRVQSTLILLAGWLLPIAAMAGWFASQGALNDVVDVHLKYSAFYAGLASDDRLKNLAQYFLSARVITVLLPVSIYGLAVLWRDRQPAAFLFVVWVGTTVVLVTAQGRFYAYHWLPMLPAMSVLTAFGLRELHHSAKTFAHIIAAVALLSCAAPVVLELSRFAAWRAGAIDRAAYFDGYGEPGMDMRAVEWLRTTAGPGKVYGFGFHCDVPWLSGRESVSRFCYGLPLMLGVSTPIQTQYRAEVLKALRSDPPKYIIVGTLSEQILGMRLTIADFAELDDLVRSRYREVARFGSITILEIVS